MLAASTVSPPKPLTVVPIMGTMTPEAVRLGKRITAAREARGWSRSDLARRARVDPSYVTRIEEAQYKRPSVDKVRALAFALGINVTDLTEPVPASAGIQRQLEAMGLDPQEEAQLAAEIMADVATMAPGRERIDTLRALRTLIRPRRSAQE